MGETRVDLLHLLEDLRDAYTGSLEETILTEIVANSLDSGATCVSLLTDPAMATLTVVDDGCGMQRRDLARFHNIAASSKTRGEGIGFAGVGIKLSLLLCREVLTETRRGKSHVASLWHLASRHRAPWKWVPPPGYLGARGTVVHLRLHNPLSPLVDPGYVEATLHRHFRSLLDPRFDELLGPHYPHGLRLLVNGRALNRSQASGSETAQLEVRLPRKRKASAVSYLVRDRQGMGSDQRGLTVCTLGKAIKNGWEWLGLTPASAERIHGCIEVPALAGCLTLNKADFIRTGPRGATYLAYRKAIQEVVARQLAAWGDDRDTADAARRRLARPLERDLERVLLDLAADFPLLASLVEHRKGGQRNLGIGRNGTASGGVAELAEGAPGVSTGALADPDGAVAGGDAGLAGSGSAGGGESEQAATGGRVPPVSTVTEPPSGASADEGPGAAAGEPGDAAQPAMPRAHRYGLGIQFDSRPGDPELGRLVESTVWINEAHPAYLRAAASRSEGYHVALSVALALAALAAEPAGEHGFVTTFLTSWGDAASRSKRRGSRARGG